MKNYIYSGKSTLAFTHNKTDFMAYGNGPHELPEDADIVKTLVAKQVLTEQPANDNKIKISNT